MANRSVPYIGRCGFCDQGLLRFLRCRDCQAIVACCDECELMWSDIAEVSRNPHQDASGAFPTCPSCGTSSSVWDKPTLRQLRDANVEHYIGGRSK
jgi:hypothetical protein